MKFHLQTLVAAASLALLPAAQANVVFGTSGGNVSITVLSNISVTATGTEANFLRFVFEDVYSVVPGQSFFETQSNTISLERNGAPIGGVASGSLWGSLGFTLGEIDGNDFTISFTGANGILAGDVVTIRPGTAVTNVPAALLPNLQPMFAVMTGNSGNAISGIVTIVPEPGTVALTLLGLGVVGAAAARRRA